MQQIPCSHELCSNGKIEDSHMAFVEMANNYKLAILSILIVLSVACLNSFGVAVTKYSSATQRTVVDSIRNILVWVFFLTYTGAGHEEFVLI